MASRKIIQITVDAKEATRITKGFQDRLDKIDKSAVKASGALTRMQSFMLAAFSLQGLRVLSGWTDQFTLLTSRINNFKKEGESTIDIQTRLLDIAKKNGLALDTAVDSYTKYNNALKNTGLSSKTVLDLIEATSSAFKIFGVGGEQANSAILQLSQGLQKGRLDGDEFKSVSENAGILLDLFAKQAGVARGSLKDFAAQGRLTSEVIVNSLLANLDSLNTQAEKIPATFDQMVNSSKILVAEFFGKIEKKIGIFTALGNVLMFVASNIEYLAGFVTVFAVSKIPVLIKSIQTLWAALMANPIYAIAAAILFVATAIYNNWDWIKRTFIEGYLFLKEKVAQINVMFSELAFNIGQKLASSKFTSFLVPKSVLDKDVENLKRAKKYFEDVKKERQDFLNPKIIKKAKVKEDASFKSESVDPLTRAKERLDQIAALNEKYNQGKITISDYTQKVLDLNVAYSDLFSTTDQIGNGLESGFRKYHDNVKNLSKDIEKAIISTFGNMEDTLVDFVKTGKLEFKSLVSSILDDLLRIAIRQAITAPLASAFSGAFSSAPTPAAPVVASANGNIFSGGNVQKFATGGAFTNSIVSSPTMFPMKNGSKGLMGEAGPEAIMPLTRIGGKLGVASTGGGGVTVNIINNTGSEVETRESQGPDGRIIDVMITSAVKKGFNQGIFDKEMKNNYGASRTGTK